MIVPIEQSPKNLRFMRGAIGYSRTSTGLMCGNIRNDRRPTHQQVMQTGVKVVDFTPQIL